MPNCGGVVPIELDVSGVSTGGIALHCAVHRSPDTSRLWRNNLFMMPARGRLLHKASAHSIMAYSADKLDQAPTLHHERHPPNGRDIVERIALHCN